MVLEAALRDIPPSPPVDGFSELRSAGSVTRRYFRLVEIETQGGGKYASLLGN